MRKDSHGLPVASGDWNADNAAGRAYADEFVQMIRDKESPTALYHTVKAMEGQGAWSGVEVGFFHRLSEHLLA